MKNIISFWGNFKIEGSNIKFETWFISDGGSKELHIKEGSIINDTTFVIIYSYNVWKGDKNQQDYDEKTYHFKKFSSKPDSTNLFVK